MSETLYPMGYGTRLVTMDELRAAHEPHMHPELAPRLFEWIENGDGLFGIGGGYRPLGTQPDKPGFAEEGKSFHQPQRFPSGVWYAAVDLVARNDAGLLRRIFTLNGSAANPDASSLKRLLTVSKVHRSPTWAEVPVQGSPDAARWGVHCNVGTPGARGSESWHMQPVELDGWQSWVNAGRPDLRTLTLPGVTPPEIVPPTEAPVMQALRIPVRLMDTRPLGNVIPADQVVTVATAANRPTWARSAVVNVTVPGSVGPGFVTLWQGGPRPTTSNVNYMTGEMSHNLAVVPLDDQGRFVFSPAVAGCHVVIDQQGWAQ